jgi:hypothetical protein
MSPEDIMERADLEEQTVRDVYRILSAEFEEETDDNALEEGENVTDDVNTEESDDMTRS